MMRLSRRALLKTQVLQKLRRRLRKQRLRLRLGLSNLLKPALKHPGLPKIMHRGQVAILLQTRRASRYQALGRSRGKLS